MCVEEPSTLPEPKQSVGKTDSQPLDAVAALRVFGSKLRFVGEVPEHVGQVPSLGRAVIGTAKICDPNNRGQDQEVVEVPLPVGVVKSAAAKTNVVRAKN